MKKIFYFLSASTLIVACNTAPKVDDTSTAQANKIVAPDTAGLAEYQQWKAQNELANATAYMQATQAASVEPEITRPVKKTYVAPKKTSTKSRSTSHSSAPVATNTNNTSVDNTDNGSAVSESANTAKVEEKKGISKAAKGTAIGAAGGAVLGAVIAKNNRVLGGVIGGVIGGGVGYGIGRGMDKKDGRY